VRVRVCTHARGLGRAGPLGSRKLKEIVHQWHTDLVPLIERELSLYRSNELHVCVCVCCAHFNASYVYVCVSVCRGCLWVFRFLCASLTDHCVYVCAKEASARRTARTWRCCLQMYWPTRLSTSLSLTTMAMALLVGSARHALWLALAVLLRRPTMLSNSAATGRRCVSVCVRETASECMIKDVPVHLCLRACTCLSFSFSFFLSFCLCMGNPVNVRAGERPS
jgi:hypothetical protein